MLVGRRLLSRCVFFSVLVLALILQIPCAFAQSGPTIKVVSPLPGSSGGYPTYYEAYSYSSTCKAGIAAMRVYSAPGVPAFTVNSSHIETFIGLNRGSSYNTTIVAWDNCGGASAVNIPITVSSNPGVTVFVPSTTTAGGPLHIVASSQNPLCGNDINAMRIYTAPGVAPYSVFSNQVDAFLTLAPGNYNIVVQAWDNCGNVFKSSFLESVSAAPDRFLYSTGGAGPNYNTNLILFPLANGSLGSASGLLTNTGATTPLLQVLVDPAGYLLYATDGKSIFAYQINRNDGTLKKAPGSPYVIEAAPSGGKIIKLALDPNGHFLYVSDPVEQTLSTYTIDRSDGSLSHFTGQSVTAPGGFVIMNYTGAFIYETSFLSGANIQEVSTFSVDMTTGLLTPLVTYNVPDTISGILPPTAAWKYLYLPQTTGCCGEQTFAYEMLSNGALTEIPGSPFVSVDNFAILGNAVADWLTRYFWYPGTSKSSNSPVIQTSDISGSTGELSANFPTSTNGPIYEFIAEDHSGKYIYTSGGPGQSSSCVGGIICPDLFGSWSLGPSGQPVHLTGPVASGSSTTISGTIALTTSR